jgi:hypothetical protein
MHRIVFTPGVKAGKSYPVVIAFHGQPKRGKDPRDYAFPDKVQNLIVQMVKDKKIVPVILVIPVFRFEGGNWPWFNTAKFKKIVIEQLLKNNLKADRWFMFGHSGAAGCGGGGLNQAHLANPAAVGFFDTCIGKKWQDEIGLLEQKGIKTVNIHSVETSGFKPRQRPEYQADFNFGKAYEPAGLHPVACPKVHPGKELRKQRFRCAATKSKTVLGFVIDTGYGKEAHEKVLKPAIEYFLIHFANLKPER